MTKTSAASLKLSVALFVFALAYIFGPLWWPHVEYNDVGPAPMLFVGLLAFGGHLGIPVCIVPAGILAVIAIVRDTRKQFGILSLVLCVAAAAMWTTGKQIEKRDRSQQHAAPLPSEGAPSDGR